MHGLEPAHLPAPLVRTTRATCPRSAAREPGLIRRLRQSVDTS